MSRKRKPSNATVRRRLREYRCPFCGCAGKDRYDDFSTSEDEVYMKKKCSRCGQLLEFADNSPVYSVFEELSHKSATYNSVLYWKRWTKLI